MSSTNEAIGNIDDDNNKNDNNQTKGDGDLPTATNNQNVTNYIFWFAVLSIFFLTVAFLGSRLIINQGSAAYTFLSSESIFIQALENTAETDTSCGPTEAIDRTETHQSVADRESSSRGDPTSVSTNEFLSCHVKEYEYTNTASLFQVGAYIGLAWVITFASAAIALAVTWQASCAAARKISGTDQHRTLASYFTFGAFFLAIGVGTIAVSSGFLDEPYPFSLHLLDDTGTDVHEVVIDRSNGGDDQSTVKLEDFLLNEMEGSVFQVSTAAWIVLMLALSLSVTTLRIDPSPEFYTVSIKQLNQLLLVGSAIFAAHMLILSAKADLALGFIPETNSSSSIETGLGPGLVAVKNAILSYWTIVCVTTIVSVYFAARLLMSAITDRSIFDDVKIGWPTFAKLLTAFAPGFVTLLPGFTDLISTLIGE